MGMPALSPAAPAVHISVGHDRRADKYGTAAGLSRSGRYSRTWMFRRAHISLSTCGHTVTLTSPRCALRSSSIIVRDWPIPAPIESGISSCRIAWWYGSSRKSSWPESSSCRTQRLLRHADAARHQLVPPARDRVPDEDVAVQPVHRAPVRRDGLGRPVVVVGGAQLVRVAVGERPADPVDEDRRMLLQDRRLALLARQVGVGREDVLGVEELELVGQRAGSAGPRARDTARAGSVSASFSTFQIARHGLRQVVERALLGP